MKSHSTLKHSLKYALYVFIFLVGSILLYLVLAFGLSRITVDKEEESKEELSIYIMTNGVHTDIVVPVRNHQMDWGDEIKFKNTAIHATFYKEMKEGETCREIRISKEQYGRLIAYISNSFQKDEQGHFIKIETTANYGETDAFYEANGSYSMLHTCNTWANNALKYSGQKACLWTPFDTGIFLKYDN